MTEQLLDSEELNKFLDNPQVLDEIISGFLKVKLLNLTQELATYTIDQIEVHREDNSSLTSKFIGLELLELVDTLQFTVKASRVHKNDNNNSDIQSE